jgi:hypothetical protein
MLDPLADHPVVDPGPDRIRDAVADLRSRAACWDGARSEATQAQQLLESSAHAGQSAAAERAALAEFASACVGISAVLMFASAALDAYVQAFEDYTAAMRRAHEVAAASIAELTAMWRAHPETRSGAIPETRLRVLARQLADEALTDFVTAGSRAARTVADQVTELNSGWVDDANRCRWMTALARLAGYGHDVKSIPGGVGAVIAGIKLVGLARSGVPAEQTRALHARAIGAANGLALKDGRLDDASTAARLAAQTAQNYGVDAGTVARLGGLAAIGEFGIEIAFDADSLVTAGGEKGVHAALTRTAAGINVAGLVDLGGRLLVDSAPDVLEAAIPGLLAASAAYQIGDLAYAHREAIVAVAEGFVGHRTAKELP